MDLGIRGKRVLVTGASQGIGRAVALALAEEGCRVAVIARREKELRSLVDEMGGEAAGHTWRTADLMEQGVAVDVAGSLIASGGAFDGVVHGLGGGLGVKDFLASSEQWARVWQLNVGIAIDINGVVVPFMKKKKWGRVIHISSFGGSNLRGAAPYVAAKGYLNMYTKLAGSALAQDGIVVSAVMPGAVRIPGGHWDELAEANVKDPEGFLKKKMDFFRHYQPIGRFGTAEEVACFVLFLISEQASFASGSIVPVSGGGL